MKYVMNLSETWEMRATDIGQQLLLIETFKSIESRSHFSREISTCTN